MSLVTIALSITSVAGVIATFYYGIKSTRLERQKKQLDYADLQTCANDLGMKIQKVVQPQVCFTPGLNGATFANLLVAEFRDWVPVFVGNTFPIDARSDHPVAGTICQISTSRWRVHIPEELLEYTDCSILIIDDFAFSGDFLLRLKNFLLESGFQEDKVRSVCVATTKVAERSGKAPDFYWRLADNDDFYFPWGRAD